MIPLVFFFSSSLLPYYLTSSFMDNVPAGWDQQQLRRQGRSNEAADRWRGCGVQASGSFHPVAVRPVSIGVTTAGGLGGIKKPGTGARVPGGRTKKHGGIGMGAGANQNRSPNVTRTRTRPAAAIA